MAKKNDIEAAAIILFGEFQNVDDVILPCRQNPEEQLIFKDSVEKLSEEAKLVLAVIFRLPEEMFNAGRIVNGKLIKFMKHRYRWSAKRVNAATQEIRSIYE